MAEILLFKGQLWVLLVPLINITNFKIDFFLFNGKKENVNFKVCITLTIHGIE